jgi:hypothetical protein
VGAVGYILGGGVGLLGRHYGYAADHVRWIEAVTADGVLRRVTADSEPDLLWALRGAGANFGVSPQWRSTGCRWSDCWAAGGTSGLRPAPRCWGLRPVARDPPDELASSVLLLAYQIERARADGYRAIVFTPLLRPTSGRSGCTARVHGLATLPEGSTTRARYVGLHIVYRRLRRHGPRPPPGHHQPRTIGSTPAAAVAHELEHRQRESADFADPIRTPGR